MLQEIRREHIDNVISTEGSITIKVFAILLLLIYIWVPLFPILKILLAVVFIIYTDYKLHSNVKLTNNVIDYKEILKSAQTGDIILFRSYHSYDIPEYILFRMLAATIASTYFGHIGLIIRKGDEVLILECTEDKYHSLLTNTTKNGVLLHSADKRIHDYDGRIHYIKTNIHQYLQAQDIIDYILELNLHKKYFYEDGLGCVGTVSKILKHFNIIDTNKWVYTPGHFIHPTTYRNNITIQTPIIIKPFG